MPQPSKRRLRRAIVPLLVPLTLCYLDYAACYAVGYKVVFLRRLHAAAIAFWVLVGLTQASMFLYWALLLWRGPGDTPQLLPLDILGQGGADCLPLPDVFICDEQGYPYWCTKCQIIKPKRAFHSSDLQRCVPKFDHYCLWIGTAVGRDNFVPFMKFLECFGAYFLVILVTVAATTRHAISRNSLTPHYIVLYVFCVFWLTMILALFVEQCVFMLANITTVDDLTVKQARTYSRWLDRKQKAQSRVAAFFVGKVPRVEPGTRYLNIKHNGARVVVQYHVRDHPYSLGFRRNVINVALNGNRSSNIDSASRFLSALAVLFVPYVDLFVPSPTRETDLTYDNCSDEFSPSFMRFMIKKIEAGNFTYALYLPPPDTNSRKLNDTP